jgi:quercetin 2,3-dioxygenase
MSDTEAHIFLASQRQQLQTAYARNLHTLPFGTVALEPLRKLSDDTLRAGISLLVEAETDATVVLIPYIGDVSLTDSSGQTYLREEGKVYAWSVGRGETYEIRNPYEEEAVNFFQVVFTGHPTQPVWTKPIVMESKPNELLAIFEGNNRIQIGQFDGRAEGTYCVQNKARCVFIFVIEGAFEVQSRLLETRDGLALWNVDAVEFEALSQDAVLLVIEL